MPRTRSRYRTHLGDEVGADEADAYYESVQDYDEEQDQYDDERE